MTDEFLPSRYGRHLSFFHRPNPSHKLLHVEEHDSREWSLSVQNKVARKKIRNLTYTQRCWSNLRFLWFSFTLLCDWSALISRPIRFKAKTNRKLVTCFPRLKMSVYFHFERSWILPFIWLAVVITLISVCDTQSKSALSDRFICTVLSR